MDLLPLQSRRLTLRRFQAEDLANFAAYRADPVLARYQGWSPMTLEQAREFLDEQASQPFGEPGQWLQIAIVLREGSTLIGDLGVRLLQQAPEVAELGYTLVRPAQGHGYATEAVRTLLEALFGRAGVRKVNATTDARNQPSSSLLLRLGFRLEHTEEVRFRGEDCIEQTFGLARSPEDLREWSPLAPLHAVRVARQR